MAAKENTSAALTGSSEESTLAKCSSQLLTEIKELKEIVTPLVEPAYEDERDDNVEQGDEESTAAGVDKRPADDPGNKPTEKASGSKTARRNSPGTRHQWKNRGWSGWRACQAYGRTPQG